MTTIDITCDCDAKHLTYSVTDSHGVTQLVSFCAECAHGAAADWDTDGAIVKIVRDEPTEPSETTTTVDASTYWATVLGDLTEAQAVEAHGLSTLSHSELMAWLETCEATARAAGATGLDDVHGLRWDAAAALAAVSA